MDPRERADATLARARARGAFVVTPESAISPMDAANTLQLPRIVIADNDERPDPDATLVVPLSEVRPEENIPAIAQEALTDVVGSPPGIRSRQRRIEDAIARGAAVRQQKAESEATPQAADQQLAAQPGQPAHTGQQTQAAQHVQTGQQAPPAQAQSQQAQDQPERQPAEPANVDSAGAPTPPTGTPTPPTGTGSLSQRLDG
jgi:hypothetical protein